MSAPAGGLSLARLEQLTTLGLLAFAFAWLAGFWNYSKWLACIGFVAIALGYAAVLAIEFVAVKFFNASDPVPQPSGWELIRAWAGECITAPRVFCWRQPFFSNAVPDHLDAATVNRQQRGVVLIHGFVCNRGLWTPWLEQLKADGHAFVAVNLQPVFGSIDNYAPAIERAVQQVIDATGIPPVLVCHSMGGLAARAWLRTVPLGAEALRVHHIITIGTPHGGTWLGRFSHVDNGRQMRLKCDWLTDLRPHAQARVRFTCWYSNCDNIVFPASTATLPGADNRHLPGVAHVAMAFQTQLMQQSLVIIRG
jgi:pimeloyl-ACP methyl ester carboxylesterase